MTTPTNSRDIVAEATAMKLKAEAIALESRAKGKLTQVQVVQGLIAGIVAAALLSAWVIGYALPFISAKKEQYAAQVAAAQSANETVEAKRDLAEIHLERAELREQMLQEKQRQFEITSNSREQQLEVTRDKLLALIESLEADQANTKNRYEELTGQITKVISVTAPLLSQDALAKDDAGHLKTLNTNLTGLIEQLKNHATDDELAEIAEALRVQQVLLNFSITVYYFGDEAKAKAVKYQDAFATLGVSIKILENRESISRQGIQTWLPEQPDTMPDLVDALRRVRGINLGVISKQPYMFPSKGQVLIYL